jgi:hypothetical protein
MPENHPALTWGYLKDWARQNEIADDLPLTDEQGRPFRDLGQSSYYRVPDDREVECLALQIHYG